MWKCYHHFIGWRNDRNKSYRSWWVIQLCCWWFFLLKSFTDLKLYLNFSNFEFQISNYLIRVRWRNDQNKNFAPRWVLQLWFWWLFHLNHFITPIFVRSCQILKIQNLNCSNEFICTKDRYNSCRSRWVIQFCCLGFLMVVYVNECIRMRDVGVWHPGLGLNRINRILIPTSYNYSYESRSSKNFDIKRV